MMPSASTITMWNYYRHANISHIIYAHANKSERSYHCQEKYYSCLGKGREVVWIFYQHYYIEMRIVVQRVFEAWVKVGGV
jgi:hypothetical protein